MADPDESRVSNPWQQRDLTKGPRSRIGLHLILLALLPGFAVIRDLSEGGDAGPGGMAAIVGGLLFLLCLGVVAVTGAVVFFGRRTGQNSWRLIGLEVTALILSYVVLIAFGFIKL